MSTYWRYCKKCGKPVTVDLPPYDRPWPEEVHEKLDFAMEEHTCHLCKTCTEHFAECNGNPIFGECLGNDNVVSCNGHNEKEDTNG